MIRALSGSDNQDLKRISKSALSWWIALRSQTWMCYILMWARTRKPQVWLCTCTNHYWQKNNSLRYTDKMTLTAPDIQRPRGSTSTIWGSTFYIQWWDELFSRKEWLGTPNIVHVSWERLAVFIVLHFLIVITHKYKESVLDPNRVPHSSWC